MREEFEKDGEDNTRRKLFSKKFFGEDREAEATAWLEEKDRQRAEESGRRSNSINEEQIRIARSAKNAAWIAAIAATIAAISAIMAIFYHVS